MTESWIDAVRRRIADAEARLKKLSPSASEAEATVSKQPELPSSAPMAPSADRTQAARSAGGNSRRDREQQLQRMFLLLKESIILVDEDGGWELANPHLPAWLGYTPEEFKQVNLGDIFESQAAKHLLSNLPKWLNGDEVIIRRPCLLRGAHGKSLPVLLSSQPWIGEAGKRVAYLIFEDARKPEEKRFSAAPRERATTLSVPAELAEAEGGSAAIAGEWSAFGRMTPGRLRQLSQFIAKSVTDVADHIRSHPSLWASEPALTKLLHTLDRTRRTLLHWNESARHLPLAAPELRVEELLNAALAAREPELDRWRIEVSVNASDSEAKNSLCPPALFAAILHVLQACIEEVREFKGRPGLSIRAQSLGERLEVAFLYEAPVPLGPTAGAAGEPGFSEVRLTNLELMAAQRLLESMGGNLVLEKITESQRAIRVSFSLAVLIAGVADQQREEQEGTY